MPGIVGLQIMQPDLSAPTGWSGLITEVTSYTVRTEVNRAGSFSISFPATAQQANQITAGWRVTLTQEQLGASVTPPGPILHLGRVIHRQLTIDDAGQAILQIDGETALGVWNNTWIHNGRAFTSASLSAILTTLLGGASYTVPARTAAEPLTVQFNDMTVLQALIKLAELTRTNLCDEAGVVIYKDQDDVPIPAYMSAFDEPGLTFIQVEQSGPELAAAAANGFAIIAGAPTVTHEGNELANKITAIGTEFDGKPLTLQGAVGFGALYAVQTGTGDDGAPYYFLADSASQTKYGVIELNLVRSDVKNPSDNAGTRAQAKTALGAIASGTLLQRRSETLTASITPANGEDIWALPGDRAYLRFKGLAQLLDGKTTWLDIDQNMLVMRRTDAGSGAGVRLVSFDLVTPTIAYTIPSLPTAIPIPTPPSRQVPEKPNPPSKPDPTPPPKDPGADPGAGGGDTGPVHFGNDMADAIKNLAQGNGAYQACCADPTTDINAAPKGPPGSSPSLAPTLTYSPGWPAATYSVWGAGPGNAGDLLVAVVIGQDAGGLPVAGMTVSGGDYTWTLRSYLSGDSAVAIWTAPIPTAPTGAETADLSPGAYAGGLFFFHMTGIDISSDPVIQVVSTIAPADPGGTYPISLSFAPFANPNNLGMVISQLAPNLWSNLVAPYGTQLPTRFVATGINGASFQGDETQFGFVGELPMPVIGLELRTL